MHYAICTRGVGSVQSLLRLLERSAFILEYQLIPSDSKMEVIVNHVWQAEATSSSNRFMMEKQHTEAGGELFVLTKPLLFSKDVEKITKLGRSTSQASMHLEMHSCVTSLSIESSAKQIEVYIGEKEVYHSTCKGISSKDTQGFFQIDIHSLSSSEASVKIKFLSLVDRTNNTFTLNNFSVVAKTSSSSSNSNSRIGSIPTLSSSSMAMGTENKVDMGFIAQAVCQLVDAKLAPILIRLDAIEGSILRHEKSIRMLMSESVPVKAATTGTTFTSSTQDELVEPRNCTQQQLQKQKQKQDLDLDVEKLQATAKAARENAQKALDLNSLHLEEV